MPINIVFETRSVKDRFRDTVGWSNQSVYDDYFNLLIRKRMKCYKEDLKEMKDSLPTVVDKRINLKLNEYVSSYLSNSAVIQKLERQSIDRIDENTKDALSEIKKIEGNFFSDFKRESTKIMNKIAKENLDKNPQYQSFLGAQEQKIDRVITDLVMMNNKLTEQTKANFEKESRELRNKIKNSENRLETTKNAIVASQSIMLSATIGLCYLCLKK